MKAKLLGSGVIVVTLLIISSSSLATIAESELGANPMGFAQWLLPVKASIPVTSCYGPRTLMGKFHDFHEGVDFGAHLKTPVKAVAAGKVVWQGFEGCSGRTLVIEHAPLVDHRVVFSLYRHLKSFATRRGQRVRAGQIVARSGASGRRLQLEQNQQKRGCVLGPHLHLEFVALNDGVAKQYFEETLVRTAGHLGGQVSYVDPGLFLPSVRQECSLKKSRETAQAKDKPELVNRNNRDS